MRREKTSITETYNVKVNYVAGIRNSVSQLLWAQGSATA